MSLSYLASSVPILMLTFGITAGIGFGIVYVVCFVAIGQYFDRYRAVTTALLSSGCGLGMFIGPVIIRTVTNTFTLSGMFLIMGAVCFNITALSLLIRPSPFERSKQNTVAANYGNRRSVDPSTIAKFKILLANKGFMFYCLSIFTWSVGESTILIQLPIYTEKLGSSKMETTSLFIAYGGCNIVSRVLTGIMANNQDVDKKLLHGSLLGLIAVLALTFPLYAHVSWTVQMFFAGGVGLFIGGIPALIGSLTVEFVALEYLSFGFGFVSMISGLCYAIIPSVSSLIAEKMGSISYVFYISGCGVFMGSLSAFKSGTFPTSPGQPEENRTDILIMPETVLDVTNESTITESKEELYALKGKGFDAG